MCIILYKMEVIKSGFELMKSIQSLDEKTKSTAESYLNETLSNLIKLYNECYEIKNPDEKTIEFYAKTIIFNYKTIHDNIGEWGLKYVYELIRKT